MMWFLAVVTAAFVTYNLGPAAGILALLAGFVWAALLRKQEEDEKARRELEARIAALEDELELEKEERATGVSGLSHRP